MEGPAGRSPPSANRGLAFATSMTPERPGVPGNGAQRNLALRRSMAWVADYFRFAFRFFFFAVFFFAALRAGFFAAILRTVGFFFLLFGM